MKLVQKVEVGRVMSSPFLWGFLALFGFMFISASPSRTDEYQKASMYNYSIKVIYCDKRDDHHLDYYATNHFAPAIRQGRGRMPYFDTYKIKLRNVCDFSIIKKQFVKDTTIYHRTKFTTFFIFDHYTEFSRPTAD